MVVLGRAATAGTRVATAGTHNKLLNLVYQLSLVNLFYQFPYVCGSPVFSNFGCENI